MRRHAPVYIVPTPQFIEQHSCQKCAKRPRDFTKQKAAAATNDELCNRDFHRLPFLRNSCANFQARGV
jgi:hypothetical protein